MYISSSQETIEEGENAVFELRRTGAGAEKLNVLLEAFESRDMVSDDDLIDSVVFGQDETSISIEVPTEDDDVRESNSKLTVSILPDESYYRSFALEDRTVSVTISDNDIEDKIDLTFSDLITIYNEGNSRFLGNVLITDLDGDAFPDVFTFRRGNSGGQSRAEVLWIRNTGDGTFEVAETLDDEHYEIFRSGDIDFDGDIDAILREGGTSGRYVRIRNDDDGRFTRPVAMGLSRSSLNGYALEKSADVDGDRKAEFIFVKRRLLTISRYCDLVAVLDYEGLSADWRDLNTLCNDVSNGEDTADEQMYEVKDPHVALGDLDGDGDMDVLLTVASRETQDETQLYYSTLLVAGNEGDGTFNQFDRIARFESESESESLIFEPHLSDMDGDGDTDIVWLVHFVATNEDDPNKDEASLLYIENAGELEFREAKVINSFSYEENDAYTINPGIVLEDFDGDRDIDIFFYGADAQYRGFYPTHKFTLYQNLGDGTSYRKTEMTNVASIDVKSAVARDIDLDGDFDLILSSNQGVVWFRNDSNHGDDYADTMLDAKLISVLPAFIHGNLTNNDIDLFEFRAGHGTLRVKARGDNDTYGKILDSEGETVAEDDDSGEGLNFELTSEVEPATYFVQASGYDPTETGSYTLTVDFLTQAPMALTAPTPPQNLMVEAGDGEATLSWEASEDNGGSEIERHEYRSRTEDVDYGDWLVIPDSAPEGEHATEHTVTELENGVRVLFQVRAVNESFASEPSNEVGTTPKSSM